MVDEANPAHPDGLEELDDDALARLAYGRADDDNGRMLAQRAARILASRRPAPDPVPHAASMPGSPDNLAGAVDGQTPVGDDDPVDDVPTGRRLSRPVTVIAAALVVALVGAGIWLTLPREPAAFAVFGERAAAGGTPTAADDAVAARDDEFTERLRNTGEQLLSPARVLASTGLVDGGIVELVAFRAGRDGDPADRREVCVAVWGTLGAPDAQPRRWERSCLPEPEFLAAGIEGVLSLTGVEVSYAWPVAADGAAGGTSDPAAPSVSVTATGPTTVAELADLAVPALATLPPPTPAGAAPLVSSIVAVVHPPSLDPILLGPIELNRGDDGAGNAAILIGYVAPGAIPGAELSVCVVAAELGTARGIVDQRCAPASDFAASGVGSDQSPNAGFGTYAYRWEPTGESSISVLRPPG